MAITDSQCACGRKIQILTGDDVTFTRRIDGKQAIYPESPGDYQIFRCESCHAVADETVPGYNYDTEPKNNLVSQTTLPFDDNMNSNANVVISN